MPDAADDAPRTLEDLAREIVRDCPRASASATVARVGAKLADFIGDLREACRNWANAGLFLSLLLDGANVPRRAGTRSAPASASSVMLRSLGDFAELAHDRAYCTFQNVGNEVSVIASVMREMLADLRRTSDGTDSILTAFLDGTPVPHAQAGEPTSSVSSARTWRPGPGFEQARPLSEKVAAAPAGFSAVQTELLRALHAFANDAMPSADVKRRLITALHVFLDDKFGPPPEPTDPQLALDRLGVREVGIGVPVGRVQMICFADERVTYSLQRFSPAELAARVAAVRQRNTIKDQSAPHMWCEGRLERTIRLWPCPPGEPKLVVTARESN